MLDKIGTYQFHCESFNVDFSGRLAMSVLADKLLTCANFHANERNFGISDLNRDNYTWVLSRLVIEMDRMPEKGENYQIQTWVENVYRLFTNRSFAILSHDGQPIGYARTVWAMIDLTTRRPADVLSLDDCRAIADYATNEPAPIDAPSRIKVVSTTPVDTIRMKYSDIDMNVHVNSVRYIEHILDLFSLDVHRQKHIRRFEMAYSAECYFGDVLDFYQDEPESDVCQIEVKKNGAESVCSSKLFFQNR